MSYVKKKTIFFLGEKSGVGYSHTMVYGGSTSGVGEDVWK